MGYQRAGDIPGDPKARYVEPTPAKYLSRDQRLGSIEKGSWPISYLSFQRDPTKELKAIKAISMVVKDGTFYYPSEVYRTLESSPLQTHQ